jgi:hypothetical protein
VVTSRVVVVVVTVAGSSAQPIKANGASANMQMLILIYVSSLWIRFAATIRFCARIGDGDFPAIENRPRNRIAENGF